MCSYTAQKGHVPPFHPHELFLTCSSSERAFPFIWQCVMISMTASAVTKFYLLVSLFVYFGLVFSARVTLT